MQTWNLREIETPDGTRSPVVLDTLDGARAVLIGLNEGQELGEHQVHERSWITVVEGRVRFESADGAVDAEPGTLLTFDPNEPHRVVASGGSARILVLLAPWPGEGHYRGEERSLG